MTDELDETRRAPAGQPAMPGPTGEGETTELVGDPDSGDPAAAAQGGAATGAVIGAIVGGPIGAAAGGAIGAAAGGVTGGDADERHHADADTGAADARLEATSDADGAVAGPDGELRRS